MGPGATWGLFNPTINPMITREFPKSQTPFLRFQLGRYAFRPKTIPQYREEAGGARLIGTATLLEQVSVFELIAFGETEAEAMEMLRTKGTQQSES